MSDAISDKAGSFFQGYACEFDEIYTLQTQRGVRGWFNRKLRASMIIRYEKTFSSLLPITGRSVLDIGCGSGRYILKCLDLGANQVTGIDLSEEMLELAKKVITHAGAPLHQVTFIEGNFLEQSFRDRHDYAIVMGVMDYIPDPAQFIAAVAKVVSRRAVFSFPSKESIWTVQRKLRYMLRDCPLYFYSRTDVAELMRSKGFGHVTIERIKRDYFVIADI